MNYIDEVNEYFQKNKIKVIKLNHCLNDSGFTQFEGFIQLEDDNQFVKITNKIPNQVYRITNNQKELKQMRCKYSELKVNKWQEFCQAKNITINVENFEKDDEFEDDQNIDFHLNYMCDYTLK